jgi:hypothetical protein
MFMSSDFLTAANGNVELVYYYLMNKIPVPTGFAKQTQDSSKVRVFLPSS